MRKRPWLIWSVLTAVLTTGSLTAPAGDETLAQAYVAILRGDYDAGQAALSRVETKPASVADGWLDSYRQVIRSREELNQKTFQWASDNARKALADNETYFAMAFVDRARAYASDRRAFLNSSLVRNLMTTATRDARRYVEEQDWSKAHAFYSILQRLNEAPYGDEADYQRYKELRLDAARHLRLEILYKDRESLDRRTKDVDYRLLQTAFRRVDRSYFETPNYRRMAEGALDNLDSLAGTGKLWKYLDGVNNARKRSAFLRQLDEIRTRVRVDERFLLNDLISTYNRVANANRETIELPESLLIMEYVEGALDQLDEFTSMVWPADSADFDKVMMGGFEGVGIQLGIDEPTGRLKVVTPLEDSPALEAGIQPGDLIVDVDGEDTKGWTTDDAVRNIMGPANSTVVLTMYRPGNNKKIPFKLRRREIVLRTVRGVSRIENRGGDSWNYLLDPSQGIAYIRLSGFHPDSADELQSALFDARKQGMKGLILDLRYNPGGLLDVAIEIVSTFLERGEVVSTRGRRGEERQRANTTGGAPFSGLPLILLVNEGSASASEILAGALQDHGRAMVIGERTFGKGSVQRVLPLGPEARLKLTTALYYLPNGESPHRKPNAEKWGVAPGMPHLTLELTPKEVSAMIERQNKAIIINNGQKLETKENKMDEAAIARLRSDDKDDSEDEDEDEPLLTEAQITLLGSDPFEALDIDPQLELALLQMRVKVAGNMPWGKIANAAKKP